MSSYSVWHITLQSNETDETAPLTSSSGKPYTTPAGHTPKWVDSVEWHAASAFDPPTYTSLVSSSSAVVHTLGILLEDAGYKASIRDGDGLGLIKAFAGGMMGSGEAANPLKGREEREKGYEGMNRDSGGSYTRYSNQGRSVNPLRS